MDGRTDRRHCYNCIHGALERYAMLTLRERRSQTGLGLGAQAPSPK